MKKLLSLLTAGVLTMSLSGCLPFLTTKKAEPEIPTEDINAVATVKDVENALNDWHLPTQEKVKISGIDVIGRNTTDVKDVIYVKVFGETEDIKCEMFYDVSYSYTPTSGWVLQSVEGTDWDNWTVTPVTGVSEELIEEAEAELRDYDLEYHQIDCPSTPYGYVYNVEMDDFREGDNNIRVKLFLRHKTEFCNYGVKRDGGYAFEYDTYGDELSWGWKCEEETVEYGEWEYEMPRYTGKAIFRVRRNPDDADGQIGAYASLENAIAEADLHWEEGYEVYDLDGVFVYRTYPFIP